MGGLKTRDWKTRHQTAGLENARKGMYGKPKAVLHYHSIKSNQIKFICDKNKHNVTHKKQSRYVDRTQRQHATALTSALSKGNIIAVQTAKHK